jgi:FdhD protein
VEARPGSRTRTQVRSFEKDRERRRSDYVATEEPLEIRLVAGGRTQTVAVTMRTPRNDFELAAGFLFGEGVVGARHEIRTIGYCMDPGLDEEQRFNIVNVELNSPALPDLASLERHFYTSSACGVCGKATLEALRLRGCSLVPGGFEVHAEHLYELPKKLREAQGVFASTGGLHAAGLFDGSGNLVTAREDVGRHNAVDKLIGWALLEEKLLLQDHIVMVSGRSSFEIVQKCLAAGVPFVCAVSAPSSLAIDVARSFGMTLVGFLRDRRFNVYAGHERVRGGVSA